MEFFFIFIFVIIVGGVRGWFFICKKIFDNLILKEIYVLIFWNKWSLFGKILDINIIMYLSFVLINFCFKFWKWYIVKNLVFLLFMDFKS